MPREEVEEAADLRRAGQVEAALLGKLHGERHMGREGLSHEAVFR
jgi:hypothetical protein